MASKRTKRERNKVNKSRIANARAKAIAKSRIASARAMARFAASTTRKGQAR